MPVRVIDGRSRDDTKGGTDWSGGGAEGSNSWGGGGGGGVGVDGCWSVYLGCWH